ncbi:MAG TPA: cytochrome c biogenesis heme-transporting ATPase CcmA [Cellvibrionaceae bacterium]
MSEPILTLQELTCERDERLLFSHLNYRCQAGDLVQILGANGAGKTSLLRILAGLITPLEGRVLWRGKTIAHQPDFVRELLFLGHQVPVKGLLTVLENLRWLNRLQTRNPSISEREALQRVGLEACADTPCQQLSAGQRRRVLLAQLYLSQAPLWILDEPFTAIDQAGVGQLETVIDQHRHNGGLVLITSHQTLKINAMRHLDLTDFPPDNRVYDHE